MEKIKSGHRMWAPKITLREALEIRDRAKRGSKTGELAQEYGICTNSVRLIKAYKSYPPELMIKFSEEDLLKVAKLSRKKDVPLQALVQRLVDQALEDGFVETFIRRYERAN